LKKRVERVEHVRWTSILFEQYEDLKAKDFLTFLLKQYEQHGVWEIWRHKLNGLVSLFKRGSVSEIAWSFGGSEELVKAYYELQKWLYEV
jgi:type I restriction enzyme R subunit